mgnify:FL=1
MKNLWNTMIDRLQETAEKREAEKSEDEAEELYPCGDGVRLKIFDEVSEAEADGLTAELRARYPAEAISERTLCGNRFIGAVVGDGYIWAIYIPT